MTYYRVRPECDQLPKYRITSKYGRTKRDGILVAGELYNPTERKQIANPDVCFEEVDVKKHKTYWFFGARFERKDN